MGEVPLYSHPVRWAFFLDKTAKDSTHAPRSRTTLELILLSFSCPMHWGGGCLKEGLFILLQDNRIGSSVHLWWQLTETLRNDLKSVKPSHSSRDSCFFPPSIDDK